MMADMIKDLRIERDALRARVAKLEAALKETQISEASWRELAEYWETLCKAVMPQ